MGSFSADPRAGGPYPAGAPPVAPVWTGPNAGVPLSPGVVPLVKERASQWPALRLIATVLKMIAWVEGGLGAISALVAGGTLAATVGAGGFLITLFLLVGVAIGFLMTYASSEVIMLFISIEENTRAK